MSYTSDLIAAISEQLGDENGFRRAQAGPKARSVASDIENFFGDGNFDVWPTSAVSDEGNVHAAEKTGHPAPKAAASKPVATVRSTVPTFRDPSPGELTVAIPNADFDCLVLAAHRQGVHVDVALESRILGQRVTPYMSEVDFSKASSHTFCIGPDAMKHLFELTRPGVGVHDVIRGLLGTQTIATATASVSEADAIRRHSTPSYFAGAERATGRA